MILKRILKVVLKSVFKVVEKGSLDDILPIFCNATNMHLVGVESTCAKIKIGPGNRFETSE